METQEMLAAAADQAILAVGFAELRAIAADDGPEQRCPSCGSANAYWREWFDMDLDGEKTYGDGWFCPKCKAWSEDLDEVNDLDEALNIVEGNTRLTLEFRHLATLAKNAAWCIAQLKAELAAVKPAQSERRPVAAEGRAA